MEARDLKYFHISFIVNDFEREFLSRKSHRVLFERKLDDRCIRVANGVVKLEDFSL